MLLTKEVTMNLNYREAPIVVDALQGDTARALAVRFMQGESPWEIPVDAEIFVQFQCSDGTGGTFDSLPDNTPAYSVNGQVLTVYFAPQVCAVAGCTKLQVTLLSGGAQISTFPVEVHVVEQVNGHAASGEYTNLHRWLHDQEVVDSIAEEVIARLPKGDEVAY